MMFPQAIEQALSRQLHELLAGTCQVPESRELRCAVQVVRARYGGGQAGLATPDRLEAAVVAINRGERPSKRQLLFLAHGLSRPTRALAGQSVLDSALGTGLLEHWEAQAREGYLSSMHWRGLFRSYMQAGQGVGVERLRCLLSEGALALKRSWRRPPAWWEAIGRHQSLLSLSPCDLYIQEMIQEDTELLDDLRVNTDVPPGSWFWSSLVKAMRSSLDDVSDIAFHSKIPYLLGLPSRIPGSRDEILAAVLSRYAQSENHARHAELLQFALDAWRSPQLRTNNLWEMAGIAAKQMVCGWLAQEDLEDFYHVCRGQSQVDERRLKFWLRFTRQMDYTQILLGGEIRNSRNMDVRDFIAKKKDRLGDLTSGPSSNNAILMQIGGWVFIEFSETGNACYGYPTSGTNIQLGRSRYSIDDLKQRRSASSWLTHMDGHLKWEEKFLEELWRKGVFPDTLARQASTLPPSANARPTNRVPPELPPVTTATRAEGRTPDHIFRNAHEEHLMGSLEGLNVEIIDHRHNGGALWAYPRGRAEVHDQLLALGFRYVATKHGYYLS